MSILIKGAEMPKDCPMCPLAHWDASNNFTGCDVVGGKKYAMTDHEYANSNVRPDWCPLIPVPPHGRLIDADALKYTMLYKESWMHSVGVEALAVWKSDIDATPTIIEAEEEK